MNNISTSLLVQYNNQLLVIYYNDFDKTNRFLNKNQINIIKKYFK